MKLRPFSLIHRIFGARRSPLTTERAREILKRNQLYTEVTRAKPLKEWRRL